MRHLPALRSAAAAFVRAPLLHVALCAPPPDPAAAPPRAIPLAALGFYFTFFFLSSVPPGPNVLGTGPEFYDAAIALSLNFFYVLPLLAPDSAPVVDPTYEAIFEVAIAFSLLFVGFVADGRRSPAEGGLARNKFLPFLAAMPFATNLAYLAYLGARDDNDATGGPVASPLNWLERLGEARWLPLLVVAIALFSVGWGVFARPEYGPPAERLALVGSLLSTERLAYALLGDIVFFALFQGWLLEADLRRREAVPEAERRRLLSIGRFVPFFGLAYYLTQRPDLK